MPKPATDTMMRTPEPPEGPAGDPSPPQPISDVDTMTRTAPKRVIALRRRWTLAEVLSER
jgi:hypothetical protein